MGFFFLRCSLSSSILLHGTARRRQRRQEETNKKLATKEEGSRSKEKKKNCIFSRLSLCLSEINVFTLHLHYVEFYLQFNVIRFRFFKSPLGFVADLIRSLSRYSM